MKKRNTLRTLGVLSLSLVLAAFLSTCEGGYYPGVQDVKFDRLLQVNVKTTAAEPLVIECVNPSSVKDEDITITLKLDPEKLQLKLTDMDYYSQNVIGEPKDEGTETPQYYTEIVIGKLSSISIDALNPVQAGADALTVTVTVEPGGKTKTVSIPVYTYIVTFDENGGDTEAVPKKNGAINPGDHVHLPMPKPPTLKGNTFSGWNTERDGSGSEFYADTPVNADIPVYATWNPVTSTP